MMGQSFYPEPYRPPTEGLSSERPRISVHPQPAGRHTVASAAGYHRRRSARTVQPQGLTSVEPRINMAPLIDVVLVLLIVFMVVTPPPEHQLPVHLSSAERTEDPLEVAADQLVIEVEASGMRLGEESLAASELGARLDALLAPRAPEARVVFVVATDAAPYPMLVAAIEEARRAGATAVGFATDATP